MTSNCLADFVIVTALEEELDAVLDKLPGCRKIPQAEDGIHIYYQGDLPVDGSIGKYRVIVTCLPGMGQILASAATKDVIARWHPHYIVLVGIAGGIAARNIQIGDILIPDLIVGYESQKLTRGNPQVRWKPQNADARLLNAGKNFARENWQERIKCKRPGQGKSICHIGPIASGDKVIATGEVTGNLLNFWPNLIGVEMEALGVATAAFQSSDMPGFFMVRGVSDLADENKSSAVVEEWRQYACDAAASFVIALLSSGPIPMREIIQNEYIKKIREQSLPFPIEFQVETPREGQIVRKEDCPLSASGTFSSEREFHAWVILDDEDGKFYLQYPPIKFFPTQNRWEARIIRPEQGIEHIHFLYVDEQGNSEFHNMVRKDSWGAFYEFPPNSRLLCTISIDRVMDA